MPSELEIVQFRSVADLWTWLAQHHESHPGVWVQLQKSGSPHPSVGFPDLLEAGIAFGWSESSRRAYDQTSYLQKFTPRRTRGTTSARNLAIAERLEAAGRMTPAGRRALASEEKGPGRAAVTTAQIDQAIDEVGQPGDDSVEFRRAASARWTATSGGL